jgi:ketosteroid isomerase-like protein
MDQHTNEQQIHALVETWAEAVRARDMRGARANHTADIVMFDVPEPLQSIGIAEYQKTWELFFEHSPGGPGAFDIAELHVMAGETVAWCHALIRIFDSTARLTMGLRKENGQWLVAHEHHSYPLELSPSKP